MNIQYIGEHLFPGEMGKFFVWLGFGTAILASVFYLLAFYRKDKRRVLLISARGLYLAHALSVVAVASVLYFLIFNHYFEYSYVWQYSSKELPMKYIVSCFWAGQEGSFLVWALFQALIGVVLLILARKWESAVMIIFSLSQAFVTSMLLGVTFLGAKIGATPFDLLRNTVETIEGTIFTMPDYLSAVGDGNGLNPLLENIWMTIHPPILFLGYALALVPFSYAIASFLKKDYHTWINRALPWTLISLLMLGAGILLGGAWAYVSLTFGGFWSWDPVENSSLVPWMTLVAGLHFMLITRRQNFALLGAYILITLSYVLILYASFLTRSGVLGDSSAHSFGDNGMTLQLLVFMLVFFVMMVVMIGINFRKFHTAKQDILLSREFWMFIGAIIVVLAAFQIIVTTSIPVFNSLFHTDVAPPVDRVGFYNRWQMPFALLIAGFIAFSQFLTYSANDAGQFLKKLFYPLLAAIILCIPLVLTGVITRMNFILVVVFTLFALLSSIYNMLFLSSKPRNTGAIITHIGFVIFVLGAILTFSNSQVISTNTSEFDLGNRQANTENLVLMKNDTLAMTGFYVTYVNNKPKGNTTDYQVDFLTKTNGKFNLEFTLHPSVNVHPRMGAVYNPDTRHFLGRDYYTYIAIVSKEPDYIVIKAILNPYINVLWLGSVLLVVGLGIAFVRRARKRWLGNS
ncbi:MAG: cytochrome c biogenesis protein CcsA [Bacteroidales bacterium]|nr:cytochrome c biogenesis protein CcsA [Bacteroidales bacterium]